MAVAVDEAGFAAVEAGVARPCPLGRVDVVDDAMLSLCRVAGVGWLAGELARLLRPLWAGMTGSVKNQ